MVATPNMIGQPIKRQEDPRLITGMGKYVDDITLPNMLHAALLRSDRAHARIKRVDVSKAKQIPGVVAAYTGKDLEDQVGTVPCGACTPDGKHYLTLVPMHVPPSTEREHFLFLNWRRHAGVFLLKVGVLLADLLQLH